MLGFDHGIDTLDHVVNALIMERNDTRTEVHKRHSEC